MVEAKSSYPLIESAWKAEKTTPPVFSVVVDNTSSQTVLWTEKVLEEHCLKIFYSQWIKKFWLPRKLAEREKKFLYDLMTLLYNPDDLFLSTVSPNFWDVKSIKNHYNYAHINSIDIKIALKEFCRAETDNFYRQKILNVLEAFYP